MPMAAGVGGCCCCYPHSPPVPVRWVRTVPDNVTRRQGECASTSMARCVDFPKGPPCGCKVRAHCRSYPTVHATVVCSS